MQKIIIAVITGVLIMTSVSAFACGPTAEGVPTAESAETLIETDA